MSRIILEGGAPLRGRVRIPGDKSISHRALIFNALASGRASISGILESEDVQATAACLRQLGVEVDSHGVSGRSGQLKAPAESLYCGNSGTTMRLLLGVIAGQRIEARLDGDASLQKRPMARVTTPLAALGAKFPGQSERAPITISGGDLKNLTIRSPVASAQVKTAVLLAGLQADGELIFTEPALSRDHSERLLSAMGATLEREIEPDGSHTIRMVGPQPLRAVDVDVPGDISSACFFLVAGCIVPGSDIIIEHVGINPSRTGALDVLKHMGADITQLNNREVGGEPVADLQVRASALRHTQITGSLIPRLVDEIPVLAVAMAHAQGESRVCDAAELRVKESDRITSTLNILKSMGVTVTEQANGFTVLGGSPCTMRPLKVNAGLDHRIAMSTIVAGLALKGETEVLGAESIKSSFPTFMNLVDELRA